MHLRWLRRLIIYINVNINGVPTLYIFVHGVMVNITIYHILVVDKAKILPCIKTLSFV
jgi:hypothetical protein